MYCDNDFYQCKNLLYWDEAELKGYLCTLTGSECCCENSQSECSAFEEAKEE